MVATARLRTRESPTTVGRMHAQQHGQRAARPAAAGHEAQACWLRAAAGCVVTAALGCVNAGSPVDHGQLGRSARRRPGRRQFRWEGGGGVQD